MALYTVDKWGVTQAEKYLEELEQSFRLLAENPDFAGKEMNLPLQFAFITLVDI